MKNEQYIERITAYLKDKKVKCLAGAVLLSFATVCALPWMLKLSGHSLAFTGSMVSVLVFGALAWLFYRIFSQGFQGKKRRWFLPGLFGFGFSFCMVAGAQLDMKGSVPFERAGLWLSILVPGTAAAIAVRYFWDLICRWGKNSKFRVSWAELGEAEACDEKEVQDGKQVGADGTEELRKLQEERVVKKDFQIKSWLVKAGIIFLCYLPVFLAVYPGFFVYDAQDELMQVVTRNFSTHHPLVHVLLLGGIIQLFYKLTGSYNIGIACYTLFQMLVMAGIFGWCVERLKMRGLKKPGQVLLTLYFGLCPVLVMFSLCSAKDGLFTGMLLIMAVLLQEMCKAPEQFFKNRGEMLLLGLASLGMMLLRHNGFYAFLVFVPVVMLCLKKYWKKVLTYLLIVVVLYFGVDKGLTAVFHADASENQEMLTVPIMQMARVYNTAEDIPEEEKEILHRYLPEEALERYVPKVSDGVKIAFNNQEFAGNKGSFLKLWLKWGTENPFTYINAWFMTSYGFWYPDTVIDVYRGNTVFTYTYEDSSYFGYEVEQPGVRESKIPWLDEFYQNMSLEIFQQKVPVVSMLFSPGALFWMMMFLLGFLCYSGQSRRCISFVLPLLVWLTVILGPTYLVRYVVFLWFVVPLLMWEVWESLSTWENQDSV